MVPTAAISLESLPMTINGKLDRAALPTPRPEASTARAYVAPRNEVEARLAEIWAQVLGLARVGIADHFLELGGDSILAMRIVAKAAAARIRVTPRQLFDYRSIGELASVSESIGGPLDNSAAPSDSDPLLTPIQRWFLDESDAPHHFNQSLVFELDASVDAVALREALQTVLACHDAFRLRFSRDESGVWRQWEAADAALADFWSDADLRPLLDESQAAEFAARCAAVQSSLDLGAGPLFKAVNFSLRDARCLLLTCHHLIVDWVSWRVLLDELNEAYARRLSGEPIVLSPPPYSFRQWGERLRRCVAAGELDADLPYWLDLAKTRTPIPVDFVGQDNRWRDLETCAVELDAEHTSWLLHEVPAAYRTQIHEVLLAALAPVLCDWMGDEEVVLDLEGHGRDGDDIDVSRTVGWFTSLFPVRLHPSASGSSLADTLRSVKEQVRAIPHRGMSYGALRYYSDDGEVRRRLADIRPAVSFNYLGKFDMRGPLLRASSRDPGPVYSPDATRPHLLEIVAFVRDRTLTFRWRYSRCWHAHSSIEQLARASIAGLRAIVAHCMQPGAGGFTPADFPLAKLSQQTLDRLYRRHSQMESRR
jgi:non-ribosomal peptide synthase protein (TIGR01720 family)